MNSINNSTVNLLFHPLFAQKGLQVSVLRLDRIHPIISGNKWMKLTFHLEQAKSLQKQGLITMGGPWSNHVHAAAYAAKQEQLKFVAVIRSRDEMMTATLKDVKNWGGEIMYASREEEQLAFARHMAYERNYLLIEMGGEGEMGVKGVAQYLEKLNLRPFDYLVCPIGTGTTIEGIAKSGIPFKHLVAANPGIQDLYESLFSKLKHQFPAREFSIWEDQTLKKFGRWPDWLPSGMNEWYDRWGLPTDIVYTAKMFWMFMQKVENDYFPQNSSILLIHTGGLQGNRSIPQGILNF